MKKFNNHGYSLIEVLTVAGLLGLVGLLLGSMTVEIAKMRANVQDTLTTGLDSVVTTKAMQKYLWLAQPSFNNLQNQLDDNKKEFFDLWNDLPTDKWTAVADRTRTKTLGSATGTFEINFLLSDDRAKQSVYYDPKKAYKDHEPGADYSVSEDETYSKINESSNISNFNKELWQEGELLLFRSPGSHRFVDSTGGCNMNEIPREHSYLAKISGDDAVKEDWTEGSNKIFNNSDPKTKSTFKNTDDYLKSVPEVGGAVPLVQILAVRAVKFKMEPKAVAGLYDLNLYEFLNGAFVKRSTLAQDITEVEFFRESVSRGLIRVTVKQLKHPSAQPLDFKDQLLTSVEILPLSVQSNANNIVVESKVKSTRSEATRVKVKFSCASTNIRAQKNGIATGTILTGHFKFEDTLGAMHVVDIDVPSWYTFHHECQENPSAKGCLNDTKQVSISLGSTTTAGYSPLETYMKSKVAVTSAADTAVKKAPECKGNSMTFDMTGLKKNSLTTSGYHEENSSLTDKNSVLNAVYFTQRGDDSVGSNVGVTGGVGTEINWHTSEDSSEIEVEVKVPMNTGPDRGPERDAHETHTGSCEDHD